MLSRSLTQGRPVLFALVSPDVGRLLCDDLGWSRKKHAAWVADLLKQALLPV